MAVELYFSREDSNTPWGFRLAGGAEYNSSIIVINVSENSIAEKVGLQLNDIIVRVNNFPTAGITHSECHKLLSASGNQLILAIRRGDFTPETPEIENDEVKNIFEQSLQKEEKRVRFEEETEDLSKSPLLEKGDPPEILSTNPPPRKEKKWSTFLQKPKNAPPKIKKSDEKPKGDPYRVVIKKQKKKTKTEEIKKDTENEIKTTAESNEENTVIQENRNEEVNELTKEENNEVIEETSGTESEDEENQRAEIESKQSATQKFLEEKLAAVQKQLEALSQLPTTIQLTLEAVTKELETIVKVKQKTDQGLEILPDDLGLKDDDDDKLSNEDNTITEQDHSISSDGNAEKNDEVILGEDNEGFDGNLSDEEQNLIPADVSESGTLESHGNPGSECEVEVQPEPEPDPDEGLTPEEREAKRIERERLDKQQKVIPPAQLRQELQSTFPCKPIDRPIILPGGRRWSQPDDVCPAIRHPKMSDEKIAKTIETYSEVITGKLKGINFLKYQPPPKNLEYLQKSGVYKLVHDMEPPVRGISSRAEKILCEQDYYEKTQIESQ